MNKMFPKLFEHGKIGSLEISNRIIKAPTYTALSAWDGSVTDRLIRFYEQVALGGAGLVIGEYAWIDKALGEWRPGHVCAYDDKFISGLSALAQVIQDNGARAALQIGHPGVYKPGSAQIDPATGLPQNVLPQELTLEEIRELIVAYGDAARRVKVAGFDMVELHGAHGYLITQFLSPRTNKRTDAYGGSPENRMRFLKEIVTDVREKIGTDFPLSIRLNGTEYDPDGIMIEDAMEVARMLENMGVDVIHISGGSRRQGIHLTSPMGIPTGHNVWAAEAVKKVVSLPVVASGSITTPEFAEEILASGKADFVALARPLFADPYWPKKTKEGRPEDIVPCIRCNDGCQGRTNSKNKALMCTVNPALGKEKRLAITPAERRKKVAVIGGGPGGMEAARVCALRGHNVTLYEKRQLGGALVEASVPEFKADLRRLLSYYVTQMEKLKVKVVLKKATAKSIKDGGFEAVIVAVGGVPTKLDIPGIDKPIVISALDVLNQKSPVGQKVHVVGGGIIGVEVGLFLAEQGKEVIFTTRQNELMTNILPWDRTVYEQRLAKQKVTVHTGRRLEAVLGNGTMVINKDGQRQEILADTVVLATGFAPDTTLRDQLEKEDIEVYAIGDCINPRVIFEAIHEGHLAGRQV